MAILATGNTFITGDQATAATLNAAVNSATFASGAVDGSTTQLSSGAIIVRDGGITGAKLASDITISTTDSVNVTRAAGGQVSGMASGNTTGIYQRWSVNGAVKGYIGTGDQIISGGSVNDFGLVTDTGQIVFGSSSAYFGRFSTTGLAVTGTLSSTGIGAIGTSTSATTSLNLPASATGVSTLRVAHGTAPSSPVNGDIWTTTAGLYVRINGVTVGPLT